MFKKAKNWMSRKYSSHHPTQNSFDKTVLPLFQQFQNLLEGDIESYQGELNVVKHYTNPDIISSYKHLLKPLIVDRELTFDTTIGVDLGCWLGLSTFMLSTFGAKKMIGLDVNERFIQTANFLNEKNFENEINFSLIEQGQLGTLPIDSSSVDWVFANDSFSNALPSQHESMIQEVHRILRPGGTFYFSDNNNIHNPETAKRLKKTYYEYEVGDGSIDLPNGVYFTIRANIIKSKHHITDPILMNELCKATTYLWGDEITSLTSVLLHKPLAELLGKNNFDPNALTVPLHPVTGSSIGAVTDPVRFIEMTSKAGFGKSDMYFSPNSSHPESTDENNLTKSGRFYLISKKI